MTCIGHCYYFRSRLCYYSLNCHRSLATRPRRRWLPVPIRLPTCIHQFDRIISLLKDLDCICLLSIRLNAQLRERISKIDKWWKTAEEEDDIQSYISSYTNVHRTTLHGLVISSAILSRQWSLLETTGNKHAGVRRKKKATRRFVLLLHQALKRAVV